MFSSNNENFNVERPCDVPICPDSLVIRVTDCPLSANSGASIDVSWEFDNYEDEEIENNRIVWSINSETFDQETSDYEENEGNITLPNYSCIVNLKIKTSLNGTIYYSEIRTIRIL